MERKTFLLKLTGSKAEELDLLKNSLPALAGKLKNISNFSVWNAEDMVFGYYEADNEGRDEADSIIREFFEKEIKSSIFLASPGNMRLMFNSLGEPVEDKSTIRHRVFMTRLKPVSSEEYKKRHDAISNRPAPPPGQPPRKRPTNNFTIWNAGDYICGYSEVDKDFVPPDTEEARKATASWETRMLEIMDWLTDDVDHISGEKHEKVLCLYKDQP